MSGATVPSPGTPPGAGPAPVRSVAGLAVRLVRRWWPHLLALSAASAVVSTTITGALGVGDRMQDGLARLAVARLGGIRAAVLSDGLLAASAAGRAEARLRGLPGHADDRVVPAFVAEASFEAGDSRPPVRATLLACEDPGALGFAAAPAALGRDAVAINGELAAALAARAGAAIVLRLPKTGDVPADSPLGRRTDDSWSRRLRVEELLPAGGLARFSLRPTQVTGGLAVISLAALQTLLRRDEPPANALLLVGDRGRSGVTADAVAAALAQAFAPTLDDLGLEFAPVAGGDELRLTSRRLLIPPGVDEAAAAVLGPLGGRPSLAFLANAITPLEAGRPGTASIPYSTVAGRDFTAVGAPAGAGRDSTVRDSAVLAASEAPGGGLVDDEGRPLAPPGPGEIIVDRWMADDLAAQGAPVVAGAEIELRLFLPETLHGRVTETARTLRIAGIAAMRGAAVDRSLVPEVEGVTDEASIADWDPPFPFDRGRVRATPPHDEDDRYWKAYGATPKAFVDLAVARELAASRFGRTTAWHVPAAAAPPVEELRRRLAAAIRPEEAGVAVVPLEARAVAAARGSTPFGGLFLALSSFVVVAGLVLEWLLFSLLIAARRRDVGLLAAVGWPPGRVAVLLLLVAGAAAVVGGLVGAVLGPLWAGVLLDWLGTAWQSGVDRGPTAAFGLARGPLAAAASGSLLPAALAAAGVSLAAVALAARRAARLPPRLLLRGAGDVAGRRRAGLATRVVAVAAPLVAVALGWLGRSADATATLGLFFGAGMAALAGLLALVRLVLDRTAGPLRSLPGLAWRELAAGRSRSFSVAAIVAVAEFLIVAVSAFALHPPQRPGDRGSPTGGWTFLVSLAAPSGVDPADPIVRESLGLSDDERRALERCTIARIRSSSGDDASCTNLYAAGAPTVLGLGDAFLERGGFRFAAHAPLPSGETNPWTLLRVAADAPPTEPVPAILDQATAQWALKLGGIGTEFAIDAEGRKARLRIVGLLDPGILQGSVLVSEESFARLHPTRSGYRLALVDAGGMAGDAAAEAVARRAVAAAWADAGGSVTLCVDRLASLQAVQNTFLSGFQALGTLGLVLGTAGVAAVQFQGVLERLGALGLLAAVGFTPGRLRRLVLVETLLMVGLGLAAGTLAGGLALAPALLAGRAAVPARWILGTWAATLACALGAGLAAAWRIARIEPHRALAAGD